MSNLISTERAKIEEATASVNALINSLIDGFSFVETGAFLTGNSFDGTPNGEGVITGYASIDGKPVYIAAQNADVLGGSLGKAHADKIVNCMSMALRTGVPFLSIIDSKGARLGEGLSVLEGYAAINAMAARICGEIPHICVVKGYAVGQIAEFVKTADFVIMSDSAVLCNNVPMQLASKANNSAKFNEIFGAKAYISSGVANFSYKNNAELKQILFSLIKYLPSNNEGVNFVETSDDLNRTQAFTGVDAKSLLSALLDEQKFVCVYTSAALTCALGAINGESAAVIVTNGALSLCDIKFAEKFVRIADSFNMSLVNLVNSANVATTVEDEIGANSEVLASLLYTVNCTQIPKVCVVTGQAIGYSYLAFAAKNSGYDYVLALEDAVISPIEPEKAVEVCYIDEIRAAKNADETRNKIIERYEQIASNAAVAAKEGYVDNIIDGTELRKYVVSALMMLR